MTDLGESDPHIHVDVKHHADATVRALMASTFGLAGDLPSHASTGCGVQVPYLMTSTHPEKVTCLPCREYGCQQNLRLADQAEQLSRAPGMDVGLREQAGRAGKEYRDIARRFADGKETLG